MVLQPTDEPVVLVDGLAREALLDAVRRARQATDAPLVLVGHGSSGVAVLGLAIHQRRLGLDLAAVTCVGAHGEDERVSGRPLAVPPASRVPTRVVLEPADDDASRAWTAATAAAFEAAGWTVSHRPPGLR